jgi:hypothetical protein
MPNDNSTHVLSNALSNRDIIQDFIPLTQSLEWELGQQYFRERGSKAFTADAMPVPHVINNDDTLSRNAAEVLFSSLVEAEKTSTLEEEILILEPAEVLRDVMFWRGHSIPAEGMTSNQGGAPHPRPPPQGGREGRVRSFRLSIKAPTRRCCFVSFR